jgi:quaternary ammonium compound-resistance protein SugE
MRAILQSQQAGTLQSTTPRLKPGRESMAWLYLVVAGLFEIGWPLGLKKGWTDEGAHVGWILFAIVTMAVSGALLMLAQRAIPMGTAYAVWTGIGAVGAFVIGVLLFGDSASALRIASILLIVAGIIGLKLA